MIRAVVFDLDGVLRRWPSRQAWAIERRHSLPRGSIVAAATEPALLDLAVTGASTDPEWRGEIARALGGRFGPNAARAVAEWSALVGVVDPSMLQLVRDVRRTAKVALLTNATTRLAADLDTLGLADEFDLVMNSADLHLAKPDRGVFLATAERLALECTQCVVVDDEARNVVAARAVGMTAIRHRDAPTDRRRLLRLGLGLAPR